MPSPHSCFIFTPVQACLQRHVRTYLHMVSRALKNHFSTIAHSGSRLWRPLWEGLWSHPFRATRALPDFLEWPRFCLASSYPTLNRVLCLVMRLFGQISRAGAEIVRVAVDHMLVKFSWNTYISSIGPPWSTYYLGANRELHQCWNLRRSLCRIVCLIVCLPLKALPTPFYHLESDLNTMSNFGFTLNLVAAPHEHI